MRHETELRPAPVIGPLGEHLRIEALPPPCTIRWTPRRKAEVVAAIDGDLLSFDDACVRYSLSFEELTSWQRAINRNGMRGLRVTRIQQYRELFERGRSY